MSERERDREIVQMFFIGQRMPGIKPDKMIIYDGQFYAS